MPEIAKNTGILIVPLSPKAFRLGGETGVAIEIRLPKGDWFNYAPTGEKQYTSRYDTMSCTTFSALSDLEMQYNWLRKNGYVSDELHKKLDELGYIDENGNLNLSDWFTAVMSGTTDKGNDFGSVWDSIRNHGVLPQKDGFKPQDFKTIGEWLDRTRVTTAQKEKALKFRELFDVVYEFILYGQSNPAVIAEHLKHAPIHIATPVCSGWGNEGVVQACGVEQVQHATCSHGSEAKVATLTYDTYDPLNKKLAWDYPIPWAVKGVLSVKKPKPAPAKPKAFTFTRTLSNGMRGADVKALQEWLKYLGYFKLNYTTDYFGTWTEEAVNAFQLAYASEILHPIGLTLPTGKFASMSAKKLHSLMK